MTVRSWLRRIVNREDHLGPVRLGLLRMIDPVEWYMAKFDEERRRLQRQQRRGGAEGWVAYAPLERESSAARDEVLTIDPPTPVPTGDSDEDIEEYLKRREVLLEKQRPYFEEKAKSLLEGRDAFIHTSEGTVRARLVRFRNGAVFEHWHTSDRSTGHGRTRIERQHLSDPVGELVNYLADATLDLD